MAQEPVASSPDARLEVFVPPAPTVLAGLGALSVGSLAALAVELADATASPVGVRVGFLAAMFMAIVGIFAVLYCVEMRRAFIEACTSEAQDLEMRSKLAREEATDEIPELAISRLGELSSVLRKTGALEAASEVDDIRRDVLTLARPAGLP